MESNWRIVLLDWLNIDVMNLTWIEQFAFTCVILLLIAIFQKITEIIINKVISRIVRATKAKWDDVLLDQKVLDNLISILPAIALVVLLPFVFVGNHTLYDLAQRLSWIYLVGIILRFILSFFTALMHILDKNEAFRDKPVKGAIQMIQVIFILFASIIIISIVVNKSPIYLLTGIGASAAVLMLIFQDLILGLVAGIQLSANKMLQVGDWVVVKDKGIDGTVVEITLTTVKVMNWDNTISTIQPQTLVKDSFTNWENVFSLGGRRIARSVNIDISSVRFMKHSELERWRDDKLIGDMVNETEMRIDAALQEEDHITAQSLQLTNLTLFRHYMQQLIATLPTTHKGFISMVRLLDPTPHGQPMQLYLFSNNTEWVKYEGIQARIFEYLYAIAPEFDIRIHQLPSGSDIRQRLN